MISSIAARTPYLALEMDRLQIIPGETIDHPRKGVFGFTTRHVDQRNVRVLQQKAAVAGPNAMDVIDDNGAVKNK